MGKKLALMAREKAFTASFPAGTTCELLCGDRRKCHGTPDIAHWKSQMTHNDNPYQSSESVLDRKPPRTVKLWKVVVFCLVSSLTMSLFVVSNLPEPIRKSIRQLCWAILFWLTDLGIPRDFALIIVGLGTLVAQFLIGVAAPVGILVFWWKPWQKRRKEEEVETP
jgi:hypothetical protein